MSFVFCFGANEAGIHGAGAALAARLDHGAVWGQGVGRQGDSYAIPTKGMVLYSGGNVGVGRTLAITLIKDYVDQFIQYTKDNPTLNFMVTQIGTGHAGLTREQMAPLFAEAPDNCWFDTEWKPLLGEEKKYWGTFRNGKYAYTQEALMLEGE